MDHGDVTVTVLVAVALQKTGDMTDRSRLVLVVEVRSHLPMAEVDRDDVMSLVAVDVNTNGRGQSYHSWQTQWY